MNGSVEQIAISNNDLDQDMCRQALQEETANWLLDDGPVLKTVYTVYDRQFSDGQREMCVTQSTRIRQKGPLMMPNRAKRGESEKRIQNDEDSAKRAKQAVRLRCKQISADRMITLTYRENVQDMKRVMRDWDAFRRRMAKLKDFQYVGTVERQERGAFHLHIAVHGRQSYHLLKSIWLSIVGVEKNADGTDRVMGTAHVRNPNDFHKNKPRGAKKHNKELQHLIAAYLSKYITKDDENHDLNKKRYWSSKGIVIPEKNYYQLPYGTTESQAYAHILDIAARHNGEGMVFFSNSALGVCWVATAPLA